MDNVVRFPKTPVNTQLHCNCNSTVYRIGLKVLQCTKCKGNANLLDTVKAIIGYPNELPGHDETLHPGYISRTCGRCEGTNFLVLRSGALCATCENSSWIKWSVIIPELRVNDKLFEKPNVRRAALEYDRRVNLMESCANFHNRE